MQAKSACKRKDGRENFIGGKCSLFAPRKGTIRGANGLHSSRTMTALQGDRKRREKQGPARKHSPRRANHFATRTGYHNQWPIPIKIHSGRRRGLGNNVFTLFRRGRQMRLPHQRPCMWPNRWSIRVHKSDRLKSFPSRCCLSYPRTVGDCPNVSRSAMKNGTIPLSETVLG
jgi:hypothetical protein